MTPTSSDLPAAPTLTDAGRYVMLVCAFLGWFCAGFHLATTSLTMRSAAIDLLGRTGNLDRQGFQKLSQLTPKPGRPKAESKLTADEETQLKDWDVQVAQWFAWLQCSFLFGAATGGLVFGRLGDRVGRSKAMAFSILMYSIMAFAASLSQSPWHLLVLWFLACTGVGGMWPNGVALVSEAWSSLSRPAAAGIIGTSANIGIFVIASLAAVWPITPDHWRWVMHIDSVAVVLGLFSLFVVPESPRWLATRQAEATGQQAAVSLGEIFWPPLLPITLVGIALATIPLIGGWGSANWMVPWAEKVGAAADPPNMTLKAHVQMSRSLTGVVGSLIGGWVGSFLGRRRAYALISLACLICAQYAFWFVVPTDRDFLFWVGAIGFFSGIYFGWLPLFLPELFPTRVRSTGAGVSFNFGRVLTAITVFTNGMMMAHFAGDFARIGRITSLCFALGIIVIYFAPDTSKRQLED